MYNNSVLEEKLIKLCINTYVCARIYVRVYKNNEKRMLVATNL
jgi:hypothetical protein